MMKRMGRTVWLMLGLAGCADQPVALSPVPPVTQEYQIAAPITLANGNAGYSVDCADRPGQCIPLGNQTCPSGYRINAANYQATSGMHPRSIDVECVRSWY
jgi:hypothetical protein